MLFLHSASENVIIKHCRIAAVYAERAQKRVQQEAPPETFNLPMQEASLAVDASTDWLIDIVDARRATYGMATATNLRGTYNNYVWAALRRQKLSFGSGVRQATRPVKLTHPSPGSANVDAWREETIGLSRIVKPASTMARRSSRFTNEFRIHESVAKPRRRRLCSRISANRNVIA
jgi:hypothetical protein